MIERSIPFKAPMVRALLAGEKTQTRRIFKAKNGGVWPNLNDRPSMGQIMRNSLYGQPGDRLWVQEAHYLTDNGDQEYAVYATDSEAVREHLTSIDRLPPDFPAEVKAQHRKLRPSIHMPRWASRITLEVTGVRVERLNDISEADALAEGIQRYTGSLRWVRYLDAITGEACHNTAAEAFKELWIGINGQESWDANPWVWAIKFKRIDKAGAP